MKTLPLMAALPLWLLASAVQADEIPRQQGKTVNFSVCEKAEDCVLEQSACGEWVSINKNAEQMFGQVMTMMRTQVKCQKIEPATKPDATDCVNKQCKVK